MEEHKEIDAGKPDDFYHSNEARKEGFKSNDLLRLTAENATDYAIITLNADAKVAVWSRGAELIFSYSEEEALGKHISLIFTPEDIADGAPERELRVAQENGRAEDERWHVAKDDKRFFMSGVMTSIRTNEGELIGYAKIARDITTRKLQEDLKDEFIEIASHELKTPVSSLKAYTEILLERLQNLGDRQSTTMVQKLNNQIDRLTQLIRKLLDSTNLVGGETLLKTEKVDLNALINEKVEELSHLTNKHSILFREGSLTPVNADRDLIGQVISNLISNGIKYSPAGGDVIVSSLKTDKEVVVRVQDFGIGIPDSMHSRVFDRYFRVRGKFEETLPGFGLGLYISDSIVRRHGGVISVHSTEGKGSIFSFTLPLDL